MAQEDQAGEDGGARHTAAVSTLLVDLLELIRRRTGYALVMVTRRLGEDWRVVQVSDGSYGVAAGDTLRWSDSICSRMAATGDAGPWMVSDVEHDPVGDAPVRAHKAIGSYAGVALVDGAGGLLGTLCAIDPQPGLRAERDLLEFGGAFAAWSLTESVERAARERTAERRLLAGRGAAGATLVPEVAWGRALATEADRTRWTGERLTVGLLRRTAATRERGGAQELADRLREQLHRDDAVAVLGSNRVGVLSVDPPGAEAGRMPACCDALDDPPGSVAWVCEEVAGSEPVVEVLASLEERLVGRAASARAASQLRVHAFCGACGLKGLYRREETGMWRCKYCRVVLDAGPG